MTIKTETRLADFDFWGGAEQIAERLTNAELDQIETELEELYPDGIGATNLNDLFWFDTEFVLSLIGETEDSVFHRE